MKFPARVHMTEVGPRDGLQNEGTPVPTEAKAAFVRALVEAGHTEIEVTSFVRAACLVSESDTSVKRSISSILTMPSDGSITREQHALPSPSTGGSEKYDMRMASICDARRARRMSRTSPLMVLYSARRAFVGSSSASSGVNFLKHETLRST